MAVDQRTLHEAAMWAVRTSEPDFEDWPAFTQWLEASAAHAQAYDAAMLAAEEAAAALGTMPANDPEWSEEDEDEERAPRRWLAPALAACLAIAAALWLWPAGADDLTYSTAPGETRTIALDDGSTVVLAGGSELVVEADDAREARLNSGGAVFEIRHDEADPFRLAVGNATLVDAGTVFEVTIRDSAVAVGVAEGAVIYDSAGTAARIDPGELLSFDKGTGAYRMDSLPVEQVGEWRTGRLTFRGASLADVAGELSRATGVDYRVTQADRGRTISGSVTIEPLRRDPAAIGPLLGIGVRQDGDAWFLDGS